MGTRCTAPHARERRELLCRGRVDANRVVEVAELGAQAHGGREALGHLTSVGTQVVQSNDSAVVPQVAHKLSTVSQPAVSAWSIGCVHTMMPPSTFK